MIKINGIRMWTKSGEELKKKRFGDKGQRKGG